MLRYRDKSLTMSSPQPTAEKPESYLGAWIATCLLLVAFVAGLVAFPPSFQAPTAETSSNVLFVGRFHPILVHTPVGALLLLVLVELFCLTRRGESKFGPAALLILWVGAAGSIVAVLAGIMLSREGGYLGGNFTLHQSMAIIGTTGVLLALVIRLYAMAQHSSELLHAYRAIFLIAFAIMGLGAHFGGNMSHGNTFLTKHAPPAIRERMIGFEKFMLSFAGPTKEAPAVVETPMPSSTADKTLKKAPAIPDTTPHPAVVAGPSASVPTIHEKLVFQDLILPIFESKCNKCHNEEKSKGDLRLDNFEMVMKGGENGKNVVPGKPDESLTIQRILLAADDDDHMPPDGKEQLTPGEIALLRWWVEQGASSTQKVDGSAFPPDVKILVDQMLKKVASEQSPAPNPANS
jgi:uncharacterized membrane protein